ncbi:YihY/virulence factor BrkB family protein [uncultured Jatrophihabitans sp.]|uniref:YihY/virulence factor BrkB family protein n=1 Tax=uncultured Jatrophihabitans sp. TaxID=1610747 RepID=UPI0035CA90D7
MNPVRRLLRLGRYVPVLLKRTVAKAWNDRVLGLSAEAAFWQMLSLPSLFLALLAALGYVSRWFGPGTVDRTQKQIENVSSRAFSEQVVNQVIAPTLHQVLRGDRASALSIGFALALWAGSSATATFVNTITIAYDQRDLRGPIRSRLLALWVFLGTVILGVFLLPMLVLGPDLLRKAFPHRAQHTVSTLISNGYYPVLVVVLLLGLTTFYKVAPPKRLPWRRGLPGAALAGVVFLLGSAGLRTYIEYIVDKNHSYGALAAPIAALLFFFILALGVLLGAELNAAIQQLKPAKSRPPRVLDPRNWQLFSGELPQVDAASADGAATGANGTPARNGKATGPVNGDARGPAAHGVTPDSVRTAAVRRLTGLREHGRLRRSDTP